MSNFPLIAIPKAPPEWATNPQLTPVARAYDGMAFPMLQIKSTAGQHVLGALLYGDRTLGYDIETKGKNLPKGSGKAAFRMMMDYFAGHVLGLRGHWDPESGLRDNFDQFRDAILDGRSALCAAESTFTGWMAKQYGMQVTKISDYGSQVSVEYMIQQWEGGGGI